MFKLPLILLISAFLIFISAKTSFAIYDPSSRPNNLFGIHILFPTELDKASRLVNSSGGEWGYVTIPIQVGDKDMEKWQQFMSECYVKKLIPLLRLSTEADYKNTGVWRKPTEADILDFANFLSSLYWPTKNRYVILFNEVNRFDEWEGQAPNPEEFAGLVSYAVDVFKSRSTDYYLILGGMDNASPNDGVKYLDNFVYLRRMGVKDPTLFNKLDGFSSHSYPNPDFSQPPSSTKREGVATYKFEQEIVSSFTAGPKPFFITETGWNNQKLPGSVISRYYKTTYEEIWGKDPSLIAVTPFILESQNGAFDKFTFLKDNVLIDYAKIVQSLKKVKGSPDLNPPPPPPVKKMEKVLGVQDFRGKLKGIISEAKYSPVVKLYFRSILGL